MNKISFNGRGICDAHGSRPAGGDRRFAYPEFGDVAPQGRRPKGVTEPDEGLPAAVPQKERARHVSAGGAILRNVSRRSEVFEIHY
ncbi:MAG: hypothetical protein V1867_04145 [Candidatus Falkowbacteria bacterium]